MKPRVALLLFVACIPAVAGESDRLLNDPIFDDCDYEGGMLLWESAERKSISYYFCKKEMRYLIVSKQQRPNRPVPSVVDKILLPPVRDKEDLKFMGECEDKTKPLLTSQDNFFFVIAHRPKKKRISELENWSQGCVDYRSADIEV